MKAARLSALRAGLIYSTGIIPDTHFCQRLRVDPKTIVGLCQTHGQYTSFICFLTTNILSVFRRVRKIANDDY